MDKAQLKLREAQNAEKCRHYGLSKMANWKLNVIIVGIAAIAFFLGMQQTRLNGPNLFGYFGSTTSYQDHAAKSENRKNRKVEKRDKVRKWRDKAKQLEAEKINDLFDYMTVIENMTMADRAELRAAYKKRKQDQSVVN